MEKWPSILLSLFTDENVQRRNDADQLYKPYIGKMYHIVDLGTIEDYK